MIAFFGDSYVLESPKHIVRSTIILPLLLSIMLPLITTIHQFVIFRTDILKITTVSYICLMIMIFFLSSNILRSQLGHVWGEEL